MKKALYLLLLIGLACGALSAQGGREIWISEDFGSGTFPPAGWSVEPANTAGNWSAFSGANAGGSSPELRLSWTPQFTGASYFISPSCDTSGETTMYIDFRQFLDFYQTPFTIGLATRANNGAWHNVWTASPSGNLGPENKTVVINNSDVGSDTFQFAFFFNGSSYNIDYWYIDDVKFYTPFPYDLAITGATLPSHVEAGSSVTPSCVVKNAGLNSLTALVSLTVFRGDNVEASHPDYFSAMLGSLESQTVTFPNFTPSLPDELYRFEFNVSSLEDVVDDDLDNNELSAYVNTWTGAKQMVVLEIGTGCWCTYCPGAAMAAEDFIDGGYNVAVIENHNGDPYANEASDARNTYYGISGFPTGVFDGVLSYVGGNHTTSVFPSYLPLYNQRNAVKTPLNLQIFGEQTRENYLITVRVDKFAPIAYPNLVLHLALTESGISYSWQGQDHVSFVDRAMYPSYEGTPLDLDGAPLGVTDTEIAITKDASWVNANCELVAFIQNLDTKEVLQGAKIALLDLAPPSAVEDGLAAPTASRLNSVSPNPFSASATIDYSLKASANVTIGVYNIKGQLVKTIVAAAKAAGNHSAAWDGRDQNGRPVANGTYIVLLQSGSETSARKVLLIK